MTHDLAPLKSSNLAAAGYDPASRTLTVRFHSGTTQRYHDVDPDTHAGLMRAESPDAYFHAHIRSKHIGSAVRVPAIPGDD